MTRPVFQTQKSFCLKDGSEVARKDIMPTHLLIFHLAMEQGKDNFPNVAKPLSPRACIGQRFAKLELYLMLAKVVQRFQLEYRGEAVGIRTGFVNTPDREVVLILRERRI